MRPQDREEVAVGSESVGVPASAHGYAGSLALPGEPEGPLGTPDNVVTSPEDLALNYESGVEPKVRSQWAYARIRFFRHRLAVVSLFVLIGLALLALHVAGVGTGWSSSVRRGRRR